MTFSILNNACLHGASTNLFVLLVMLQWQNEIRTYEEEMWRKVRAQDLAASETESGDLADASAYCANGPHAFREGMATNYRKHA